MSSAVQQFEELQGNAEFLFIVFYRGHWCPFCMNWIKSFATIASQIKAAGGEPVIVTAEDNSKYLAIVKDKTGFKGTAILDSSNDLAGELKKRGLLDVAISAKAGYASGMAQPAVLVIERGGTVRYSWAIKPSLSNIGGAKDRPSLLEIWQDVDAEMQGKPSIYSGNYSKQTLFQGISTKLFG